MAQELLGSLPSRLKKLKKLKKNIEDLERELAAFKNGDLPCDDCGKPGKATTCPFSSDVHNEQVEVVLCDECHHARAMEI